MWIGKDEFFTMQKAIESAIKRINALEIALSDEQRYRKLNDRLLHDRINELEIKLGFKDENGAELPEVEEDTQIPEIKITIEDYKNDPIFRLYNQMLLKVLKDE